MSLYRLIYTSVSNPDVHLRDYQALVEKAAKSNRSLEITGLLVLCRRRFVQILEGERPVIYRLFKKIEGDQRHHRVELVEFVPIEDRHHDGWSMRLVDLESLQCHESCRHVFDHAGRPTDKTYPPEDYRKVLELVRDELLVDGHAEPVRAGAV